MELEEYITHLKGFDAWTLIEPIIEKHLNEMVDINQTQLLEGKDTFGKDIRPYYSEDPYFKTPESATRYARWKRNIEPSGSYANRKMDVPNLHIDGTFHRSIMGFTTELGIDFKSDVNFAQNINSKYRDILGVDITRKEFKNLLDKIKPEVVKTLTNYVYGTK
jgi:hypothetical protein